MKLPKYVHTASLPCDTPNAISVLAAKFAGVDLALLVLLVSPQADFDDIAKEAAACFPSTPMIGCTTSGEIGTNGYTHGEIVAIALPRSHFIARTLLIPDLDDFDAQAIIDAMIQARNDMAKAEPIWTQEFTHMLIDGLSQKEDKILSELAVGLGPVPLFGGSSGDGDAFAKTFLLEDGIVYTNAAVMAQVRSRCPVKVFKTDHFNPTERRMVVTSATPSQRIVHEINAEPAAREYARILGKDPNQLTTFTFAAHPVVVRIGDKHHVRSIHEVLKNGDLTFFSAIDEGLVLSLATPENMVTHLDRELNDLSHETPPDTIWACDCMLRRKEAEQGQMVGAISKLLIDHNVIGFSTYGEQSNSMHINQTLTAVAIYPPEKDQ